MSVVDLTKIRKHLLLVIEDAESDAKALDGQPFSGRVVAENFGYAFAQIQALGKMLLEVIDHLEGTRSDEHRHRWQHISNEVATGKWCPVCGAVKSA